MQWGFFFYSIAKGCLLYSMFLMIGKDRGVVGCIGICICLLIMWGCVDVEAYGWGSCAWW